jgi:iron complex outermembrane recepter protein
VPFSLEASDNDATLAFSFIGFKTTEVSVGGRTVIDVVLQEDITSLNEVVVTALGIKRETKSLGYSVNTVTADQLTVAGNTNFASALYGKSAGVRITTAPGGASSGVNVQIRGINSLSSGSQQPLYVVDGVMIRNIEQSGANGVNNGGYWSDQKIRGNGILDVNPADIESLTILKGASAAALYGSDASRGVIVITTKRAVKGAGLGVDVNYSYSAEKVAFTPKYQNTYGPGYDRQTNIDNYGINADGFIPVDTDGDGINDAERPMFRPWAQFGPKMDGRSVPWWDGTTRKYSPQPDNYKNFYQTGLNSNFNIALSNSTDKANYRFSYTRMDYKSIARGSNMNRNTFNLNSNVKLNDKMNVDVVISYVNSLVHNRPESINRLTANYGGFFSRADYMDSYLNNYQTSTGYKYVLYNQTQLNPDEALKYNIRGSDLLEYLWRNVRDTDDENQDRLISSATMNYQISKSLKFRGRVGNDFTSIREEIKRHNEYPVEFNQTSSTGGYTVNQNRYSILYTDALLTYSKDLTKDIKLNVNAGFQSRSQKYLEQSSGTNGGLVVANWFSLNNSNNSNRNTSASRIQSLSYAYLGTLSLSYKDYLFLEATGRQEYNSNLPSANNKYFYPSLNAGFVFTDAFQLPALLSYGKLRAAYASVSNAPQPYAANVTYSQNVLSATNGSVAELSASNSYGNNNIKPERKYETELGLETKFMENKFGIDFTYYSNEVKDLILPTSTAFSTGASSKLLNVGGLKTNGIEIALNATPFNSGALRWDTRLNFSKNQTKATSLTSSEIVYYNLDGGAVLLKAEEGQAIGNIYAHPRATDANGNFIITDDGLYSLSTDYKKVGNIQPKAIGGWSNTISYKGFNLNFLMDYRFGGSIVSAPLLYATGAGMYENTMQYRDAKHGGLAYNIDGNGVKVASQNGEYHDGVLLKGVKADGTPNTTIVDAAYYYINSFYWSSGWYEKSGVYKNDYIKMREASLSYNLPKSISDKLHFQNIRVSVIGRNLFYFYRTLDNLDPEVAIGTSWNRQGVDEGSLAATRSYGFSIHASF